MRSMGSSREPQPRRSRSRYRLMQAALKAGYAALQSQVLRQISGTDPGPDPRLRKIWAFRRAGPACSTVASRYTDDPVKASEGRVDRVVFPPYLRLTSDLCRAVPAKVVEMANFRFS